VLALCLAAFSHCPSLRAEAEPEGGARVARPQLPEDYFPQLRTILDDALRQSPRMLLARLDLDAAAGDRTQARAGLYPSLRSTSRLMRTSDLRRDRPGQTLEATKTYYDIGLTQPLFHWGEKRNTAQIGAIRAAIAERNYGEAYRALAREIRQSYLSLIVLKSQLVSMRFAREQAEATLQAAEERVSHGLLPRSGLFGTQIALERAELSHASTESAFIAAQEQLEVLTGATAPEEDALPDELPRMRADPNSSDSRLASFTAQAEPSSPTLENLRQQVDVARLTYKNQKTRLRPKFNLVVGVSQDEQSYTLNNAQRYGLTSRYAGVQVNWSIFDGWATRGAVRSALARLRQSEARYAQAQAAAPRQARAASRALELAQRQMQINDQLLDVTAGNLNISQDDFAAGRIPREAFDQAQAGYYAERVSANTARLNFLMAQVDLLTQIDRDPLIEHLPKP